MRALAALICAALAPFLSGAAGFRFFDPLDPSEVPGRLSETGLFQGMDRGKPCDGAHRFEINAALWSDGAAKLRHIILPPDARIQWRPDSAFGFPVGAVFAKTFLIDTIQGDSTSRIALETRLLVKRHPDGVPEAQWYGFSYRWERDQSEARLVDPETGLDTTYQVYGTDGGILSKPWTFPSQNACWRCHLPRGRQVLGFFAAQLHGAVPGRDQLADLARAGVFAAEPDTAGLHRWRPPGDARAPLEARARSYLAANCSFCHGVEGFRALGAFLSALHDFDWFRPDMPINYVNKAAKYDYGIPGTLLVYGGDANRSILIHRMRSRVKPVQMPPLATNEADTSAMAMLSAWIESLPGPASNLLGAGSGPPVGMKSGSGSSAEGRRKYDLQGRRLPAFKLILPPLGAAGSPGGYPSTINERTSQGD